MEHFETVVSCRFLWNSGWILSLRFSSVEDWVCVLMHFGTSFSRLQADLVFAPFVFRSDAFWFHLIPVGVFVSQHFATRLGACFFAVSDHLVNLCDSGWSFCFRAWLQPVDIARFSVSILLSVATFRGNWFVLPRLLRLAFL